MHDEVQFKTHNKFDELCESMLGKLAATGLVAGSLFAGTPAARAAGTDYNKVPDISQFMPSAVDFKKVIHMIGQQETGHIKDTAKRNRSVGDHGDAIGKYQIHSEVITDVNNHYGTHYKHAEMFDPVKSEDVLKKYLEYWGNEYKQHTGQELTYQVLARIWNGGPKGYKKPATNKYWLDAKQYLN